MKILNMRRKIVINLISIFFAFVFVQTPIFAQQNATPPPPDKIYDAVVLKIVEEKNIEVSPGTVQPYQIVEAKIIGGDLDGKTVPVELGGILVANENQKMKVGDKIIITRLEKIDGSEQFFFTDFIRRTQLLILVIAFVAAVVIVGRLRGLLSFVGLVISFVVLLKYIIPQIVAGASPVFVAITGSSVILLATLYLAHGVSKKTTAALLGTIISLIITGALAFFFVNITRLSGFGSEDAAMLSMFPGVNLNLQGILLAGIIIGALGVLDDITISQAACVFELNSANKNLTFSELYKRGLRIGQDHIASLVNTLVLAYAGASLPLLILFAVSGAEPMGILLNREMIANEVVRTIVGSLGLVSAVPITTALAAGFSRISTANN